MIQVKGWPEKDLTEFQCSGAVSEGEIIDVISDFYSNDPTRKVIFDLSDANVSSVSAQDIRRIAIFAKDKAHSRPEGMTALVGPGEINFGISRMYQTFAELADQDVEVRIFRDRETALAWMDESA